VANATNINILGKDYLTEKEAAHYACVSQRQFQNKAKEYGILPTKFMGKFVYRKDDIRNAIESEIKIPVLPG